MTLMGYTSRNIPSPKTFEDVLDTRMKAKAEGNKALNYALKLVVNTTYGAMLNRYNALYDPLMGRSVCITGQLFLLELTEHLYQEIESLTVCQNNTDGLMVEFDEEDYPRVQEIVQEWQDRTGFELEEDKIVKIIQKDVNGYLEILEDGSVKAKGGYLVRGIAKAGAFNINNNACIVAKAIKDYFAYGIPVEKTINECDDIFQFQMIAKAGSKYSGAFQLVDGEKVPTQKVNRVYASKDEKYGTLYKVKNGTNAVAKIGSLPEHCIIDNSNELTIDSVDKSYYIKEAVKKVNDFLGIKSKSKKGRKNMSEETKNSTSQTAEKPETEEKKSPRKNTHTSTAKGGNVYQRLLEARIKFQESGAKKTGKNMHLSFMYFELTDIVPVANKIFKEVGILPIMNFDDTVAYAEVVNVDNPDESITFRAPFNQIQPIISSKTGTKATNEMQAEGSSITYMRRYLYQLILDICENDESDAEIGSPIPPEKGDGAKKPSIPVSHPAAKPTAPHIPMSEEKREGIEKVLTDSDGNASELQIKSLKKALATLLKKDPAKEEMINSIAIKTKGFTQISKTECENVMQGVAKLLKGE